MLLAGFSRQRHRGFTREAQTAAPPCKPPVAAAPYRFQPNGFSTRREMYYSIVWGVILLALGGGVGEIIRFTYRTWTRTWPRLSTTRNSILALISFDKGVKLVIPSLEQVGQLRQSSTPVAGKVLLDGVLEQRAVLKRRRPLRCSHWEFSRKGD